MHNSYVIDRRLNGKNKSAVNRRRFIERYHKRIKKSVSDAVDSRSITDIERGQDVVIPADDLKEPFFHHGQGGNRSYVNTGNKEFSAGDRIKKPPQGAGGGDGSGSGSASDQGMGEDDFAFHISTSEFLEFLFEDLELPNLVRKELAKLEETSYRRAGFTSAGVPAKLNIVRSLRNAQARKIAITGGLRKKLRTLKQELESLDETNQDDVARIEEIKTEITRLRLRIANTPFIDDIDLRYNRFEPIQTPSNAAVMFCLMDVSGSMSQETKDIAKRFYLLLYMFLKRNYEKIEIVFIRHHTAAKEVEEEEFFYSRETGGTIVSSALKLTMDVISQRFSPNAWNIFVAQASDGDNWTNDSPTCVELLTRHLLPICQHYAYIEITDGEHQALWEHYLRVQKQFQDRFAMEHIRSVADIYPVFRQLFQKQGVA